MSFVTPVLGVSWSSAQYFDHTRWQAVPLGDALIRFDESWKNLFHYHQPMKQAAPSKSDARP